MKEKELQFRHAETERRLQWLEEHYSHFNEEMGSVRSNVEWLIWAVRWIIAGIGGTLLISLINLVLRLKL